MGLYNKTHKVSTEYTNYNIENVSFRAFNDFVYENGNPLFIGSDNNIYQLKSLGTFELVGAKPLNLTTSTQKSYLQFNNCILNVVRDQSIYTAVYSLNYGKTWNTFEFNSSLLEGNTQFSPTYLYTFAYLNNCLGVYAVIRDGYSNYRYAWVYTSDFETATIGYQLSRNYETNSLTSAKINNNAFAIQQSDTLVTFTNFDNYIDSRVADGKIAPLANNIIRTTTNFNSSLTYPPLFAYKYENGEITRLGPFTAEISDRFTLQNWLYYNNYIYKWAVKEPAWMCELYKIDLNDLTETVFSFNFRIDSTEPFAKLVNNYLVFGYSDSLLIGMLNLDNNKFFLFNKAEAINNYAVYVEQDKPNHFVIYTPTNYTETTSRSITPEERTTIYRNDYSTITGSQVLENAVRSVNHRIYTISLKDNMEIGSKIVSDNYTSNPIYADGEKLGGTKDRREIYILTGTATIKTDKPIIGDLTKSNFKFYYNNKECDFTGNSADFYNLMNNIDEQYYTGNTPFPIQLSDLSNIGFSINESGVKDISEWVKRLQFDTSNYVNEITNIVKVDDYTVTFNYRLTTKYIYFSTLSGNNYSMVEYYQSKNINIVLSTISIDNTDDQFVFSIDTQDGEYVQNNPLARSDNELFSLADTFFQDQANAIIQANKDGRMILTVNSTSDLNLYLGKELQVELKDGTLANNGATFEVTGIKEKFTGINWKQTYTLKEKKST